LNVGNTTGVALFALLVVTVYSCNRDSKQSRRNGSAVSPGGSSRNGTVSGGGSGYHGGPFMEQHRANKVRKTVIVFFQNCLKRFPQVMTILPR
jgi:hypothetical protein